MTTDDYQALRRELIRDEGVRLKPYMDSTGHITIGFGRNLTDVGISMDEANELLTNDIAGVIGAVEHALPWFPRLDGVRQRVLLNMAYNLGVNGLLAWPHMLEAVRTGDYDEAANLMTNSKWATQVKSRAVRLARMMRTGAAA